MRGKRRPSDGRTQAHPALSSVGIPQRVCLPPPTCLCPCPPRLRASFPVQTDHAKESHLRNSCSSLLLSFSRTCYTKRTVHIRTVRFYAPSRTCEKPPFLRKTSFPAMSFVSFLQEKKSSPLSFLSRKKNRSACAGSAGPQTDGRRHILRCRRSEYRSGYASLLRLVSARVRRACAPAFPCKPTTQKKVICGTVALRCCCLFREHATQDGRFTYEPSVFLFRAGRTGKRFFSERPLSPAVSFVSFLQEKKTYPFQEKKPSPIPFRRKETVPLSRSAPRRSAADRPRRNTRS